MRFLEKTERTEQEENVQKRERDLKAFKELLRNGETAPEFLESIPENRRKAVEKAYENAAPEVRKMIEKYGDRLSVKESQLHQSGGYQKNEIYMQRGLDDEEYGEIFRHELAHYLDERQGWYSERADYLNAVYDDTMLYETNGAEGGRAREEMLDELFSGDVCYDRCVSDIISAVTRNSPGVILRYAWEGVPYYKHSNRYFEKGHNRENEIYADMMACIGENKEETVAFLKKYFPNTYEATEKSIGEDNAA